MKVVDLHESSLILLSIEQKRVKSNMLTMEKKRWGA